MNRVARATKSSGGRRRMICHRTLDVMLRRRPIEPSSAWLAIAAKPIARARMTSPGMLADGGYEHRDRHDAGGVEQVGVVAEANARPHSVPGKRKEAA